VVRIAVGARDISLLHYVQTGFGTHQASYTVTTGSCSPGVKLHGREADHSPPSGWPGFGSWEGQDLSLLHGVHTDSEAHPASSPAGTGATSQRVKRPGCDADHSPPSRADVMNGGAILPPASSWRGA
jgi:hypothetical protein